MSQHYRNKRVVASDMMTVYFLLVPAALVSVSHLLMVLWTWSPDFFQLAYHDSQNGILSRATLMLHPPAQQKLILIISVLSSVFYVLAYIFGHRMIVGRLIRRIRVKETMGAKDAQHITNCVCMPNIMWVLGLWFAVHEKTVTPLFALAFPFTILFIEFLVAWMYLVDRRRAGQSLSDPVAHAAILLSFFAVGCATWYSLQTFGRVTDEGLRPVVLLACMAAGWCAVTAASFLLGACGGGVYVWRSRFHWAILPFPAIWLFIFAETTPKILLLFVTPILLVSAALFLGTIMVVRECPSFKLHCLARRQLDFWIIPLLIMLSAYSAKYLQYHYSGVPEDLLFADNYYFHGEHGQFLEWIQRSIEGQFVGKDFFCLYGAYYVGYYTLFAKLLGNTYIVFLLANNLLRFVGLLGLYFALRSVLRNRLLVLLFLIPWFQFRPGLGLFGLAFLFQYLHTGKSVFALWTGVVCGFTFLFSQEVGVVLGLTTAITLPFSCLARRKLGQGLNAALLFLLGCCLLTVPYFAYLAWNSALAGYLNGSLGYIRDSVGGYSFNPFPPITGGLPPNKWAAAIWENLLSLNQPDSVYRYYFPPFVLVAGAVPFFLSFLNNPLRPRPSTVVLLASLVFNALIFQIVMTRATDGHLAVTLGPAMVLFALLAERGWRMLRLFSRARAPYMHAAIAAVLVIASLWIAGGAVRERLLSLSAAYGNAEQKKEMRVPHPGESEDTKIFRELRAYVQDRTTPDDTVLAAPNMPALYHVVGRHNPTHFGQLACLVTDSHRSLLDSELAANKPKLILFSTDKKNRVDGLPDGAQMPPVMNLIEEWYDMDRIIGSVAVLSLRKTPRYDGDAAIVRVWDFSSGVQGWIPAHAVTIEDGGDRMLCQSNASRAFVWSPRFQEYADIVEITMKSEHATYGELLWRTVGDESWGSWQKNRAFPIKGGGVWETHRISLQFYNELETPRPALVQLRITLGSINTQYEIDEVRLLRCP